MAEPAAPPTEPKQEVEHINLKVKAPDGSEIFFKIKRSTHLRKLMETYCNRQGKDMSAVRFMYDGIRIKPETTPNELEMEDNDQIEMMIEQQGGC